MLLPRYVSHNVPLMDVDFFRFSFKFRNYSSTRQSVTFWNRTVDLQRQSSASKKCRTTRLRTRVRTRHGKSVSGSKAACPGTFQILSTDFRRRCTEKLENLGNTAMDSQKYDEAIKHYSELLMLDPLNVSDVLYKRSKARALRKSWKVALIDAEKV